MTVLVVEDAPMMMRIIKNALQSIPDLEIQEARDGKDALQILKSKKVDFVITDWIMPEMDGLNLTTIIRNDKELQNTPILMITTKGMKVDILQAFKAKVDGYMIKPIQPQMVVEKINEILNNKKSK